MLSENGKKKISVIVPTFNCGHYIAEAIESVLRQNLEGIEIIVVDDGSTDDTEFILKPYINKHLVRYYCQKNNGPGAARNRGIEVSQGEYIAFLDADDILLAESIEARLKFLEKYNDVALVFSDYSMEDVENKDPSLLKEKEFLEHFRDSIYCQDGKWVVFHKSFYGVYLSFTPNPIWTGTVMLRKSLLPDNSGLFRTDIRVGEDTDFWMRIIEKHRAGFIDQPLAVYKKCRSTLTRDRVRYFTDLIKHLSGLLTDPSMDSSIAKRKISGNYIGLGYGYLDMRSMSKARKAFWQAVVHHKRSTKAWACLLTCCMPLKFRLALSKVRKLVVNGKKG